MSFQLKDPTAKGIHRRNFTQPWCGQDLGLEARERPHLQRGGSIKTDTDRMLRLYLDNSVTSDQFKQFNQPLVEQHAQIDAEILRLQSEIDILGIDSLSGEQLVAEALDLHARWPTMTPDEKRRVAEQMVRRIEIGDGEAHLHLIQLPSYQETTNWQNTYRRGYTVARSSRGSAGFAWR